MEWVGDGRGPASTAKVGADLPGVPVTSLGWMPPSWRACRLPGALKDGH
jgi:hypothetical protein